MSKKILNIVSSSKGDASFSNKLSSAVIEKLGSVYSGIEIQTLDLSKTPLPYLDASQIGAFFTPEEVQTSEQKEAIKNSNNAVKELMEADVIVIGVPLYNFGIPAALKAWVDQVSRAGLTFNYADGTPKGMVTNKKVYLSVASGAIFSEGAFKSYDFAEPYLRAVLGFLGMTDVTTFRVEGTSIPDFAENALPKALAAVNAFSFT